MCTCNLTSITFSCVTSKKVFIPSLIHPNIKNYITYANIWNNMYNSVYRHFHREVWELSFTFQRNIIVFKSYIFKRRLGLPVKKFQLNLNERLATFFLKIKVYPRQHVRHSYTKSIFAIYVKFTFNWVTCTFIS